MSNKPMRTLLLATVHILCLAVYLIPISTHGYNEQDGKGGAILDELHIMSDSNRDVNGETTLSTIFTNDYWGRPMNSESSHKSWRPLTILSFRYLKGIGGKTSNILYAHRLVNILTHAATAECVSILAVKLFAVSCSNQDKLLLLRCLVKLLFAVHPTHVEVTANAANRPHLFACLCAVLLCDTSLPIGMVIAVQITGLLCAETFIFQMPSVVITMLLIRWRNQSSASKQHLSSLLPPILKIFPRVLILFVLSVSYVVMRFVWDWVSIPDGLIRPAENPFYLFQGWHRVRNYAYIVAVHVFKSWNLDFVGFSHEYGFECIRELRAFTDPRFGVVILTVGILVRLCVKLKTLDDALTMLFHLSWMATLFPISGIVKVGTFVADRIVVASTVSTCILGGWWMTQWIMPTSATSTTAGSGEQAAPRMRYIRLVLGLALIGRMWYRVHCRSLDWMDSHALLKSSLETCPRSAKSNLEISKVYSGLQPDLFDLNKSLDHLKKVEQIDPSYCDVHQQFSHCYIQQQNYIDFEKRLAKAVLCPFTMGGATEMWRRYWPAATRDPVGGEAAKSRLMVFEKQLQAAIEREQRELSEGKPQWKGASLE